jgi:hypothetical protein
MKDLKLPIVILSLIFVGSALPAIAYDNNCPSGVIVGGIHDNITILAGTSCTVYNATVIGDIKAEPGHGFIQIYGGTVEGDVKIKGGTMDRSFCSSTTIGGNFQAKENLAVIAWDCRINNGDLQLSQNQWIEVYYTTVNGNLQCKENGWAFGAYNIVSGGKKGQCANLTPLP